MVVMDMEHDPIYDTAYDILCLSYQWYHRITFHDGFIFDKIGFPAKMLRETTQYSSTVHWQVVKSSCLKQSSKLV